MPNTSHCPCTEEKNIHFSIPVDFSNIEFNSYAQQMLRRLRGKSKQEIEEIVFCNMFVITRQGVERDLEVLDLAKNDQNISTGYLDSNERIEHFWTAIARHCSKRAVTWMQKHRLL